MAAQSSTSPDLKRMSLDGVDLAYYEEGSGPPLLALHGMIELPRWQPYHAALARTFRVIAPNHPGFSGSSRPDWMESIDDLAFFYLDLLRALNVREARLLGTSFGGWIAAEMAIRCSAGLKSLALVNPLGLRVMEQPFGPPGGSVADWLVLEPDELRAKAWHDPSTGDRLKLPAEEATTDDELTEMIVNRQAATVYAWRPFFYNPRLQNWLHRIDIPTLIVWGAHDGVAQRGVGEAYAARIPGARLQLMEGSAHMPHLEQPEEFVRLAGEFLA
ncbi:MAG: alpha/beta hydrolase [Chloroflexi bacterium]|nr:alpha/beta hydrolase [Chloroflexota bacterium]